MKQTYRIPYYQDLKNISPDWDSPSWQRVPEARILNFRPEGSDHRPDTRVRIQRDDEAVYLLYRVDDRYVRATETRYNGKVHLDSCVEWFIKPAGFAGYFNFEMNCLGTLHVNYIIDPTRDETGRRRDIRPVPEEHAKCITIQSSILSPIVEEIKEPLLWFLGARIPFRFFEPFSDMPVDTEKPWQGNLYKCGDKTSHPHYGSWAPVSQLNFHLPQCFQEFIFTNK